MNSKLQLTQEGYDSLVAELDHLKNVDRVKNLEDLKEARAQGDLSENAEYDAARQKQGEIEVRIKEIEQALKNATIISGASSTNLGKIVTFEYEDTHEVEEYKLVGTIESNPAEGKISNESPIGAAILKAKVGDTVLIKTEAEEFYITIKDIKNDAK